tara:strand:- start:167 stop:1357 length:1191 start_codon:yes stop_codon:yes gene_type:complete
MFKPDKTKTTYELLPDGEPDYGSIKEYKPNFIDKVKDAIPSTGPLGVLKGLYGGLDDALFGALPSGKYKEIPTNEMDTGGLLSYFANPYAYLKGAKMAVSGIKLGDKTYGTPIGKLIANSIEPINYNNKWGAIKRTLKNPKVFKDAVINDMPQYKLHPGAEDRLFAWRKKFGLGKPNEKYNRILDPVGYNKYTASKKTVNDFKNYNEEFSEIKEMKDRIKNYKAPLDRIWDKFGKHTEGGKEYYHYKNSKDFFDTMQKVRTWGSSPQAQAIKPSGLLGSTDKHNLFGYYSKKSTWKDYVPNTSKVERKKYKDLDDYFHAKAVEDSKKRIHKVHYYDNWDFGLNRNFKEQLTSDGNSIKHNLPVVIQRILGNALVRDLQFKGTAKRIKQFDPSIRID